MSPNTILTAGQLNDLIDARNQMTLILAKFYCLADAARHRGAGDLETFLYECAGLASQTRHKTEKAILWGAAEASHERSAVTSVGATADVADGHEMPQNQGAVR